MNEIVNFLKENPVQYLATVSSDNKATCRPFMFGFEYEGKLWFCTGNKKEVYRHLNENPYFEICISNAKFEWLRLNGKAVFENNMQVKENFMNIPIVKGIYNTADNPDFEVFYAGEANAIIADFSKNPPKTFKL